MQIKRQFVISDLVSCPARVQGRQVAKSLIAPYVNLLMLRRDYPQMHIAAQTMGSLTVRQLYELQ